MKKSLLAIFVAAATVTGAGARTLSPEQALGRALGGNTPSRSAAALKKTPLLTLSESGAPMVYLFENVSDEGFMVLSADDIAAPVLGYSEEGKLDPDNLPVNLSWWLEQYKGEIAAAVAAGIDTPYEEVRSRADRSPIAPLMSTRWNQDAPYNLQCPLISGKRAVTGCVATAMAQVLKYHNWPEKGVGKHQYNLGTQTISFDYASTTFDWNNMLDTYTSSATTTQNNAVATLMLACGVAVDMKYTASESGAISCKVTPALISYFNYDKGVHSVCRSAYTSSVWEEMIYGELANNGPVFYAGQSSEGGHAFVCDGYSSNGYFHFNWGWGGMSDGYFRLNALDPSSQGIGGSSSGFNFDQMAIIGVKKPVADSEYAAPYFVYYEKLDAQMVGEMLRLVGTVFNYSSKAYSGRFVVDFVNDATKATTSVAMTNETIVAVGSGYSSMGASVASLADGSYKGTLMYETGGKKYPVYLVASQLGYITLVKKGTDYTVNVPAAGQISVKDLEFTTPVYSGEQFKFVGTATNTGNVEITTPVVPLLLKSEDINDWCALGSQFNIEVPANGSAPVEYLGSFDYVRSGFTLTAGSYYFCIAEVMSQIVGSSVTDKYVAVSSIIPVEVKSNLLPASVRINSWGLGGSLNAIDPYDIQVNINVSGVTGYYTGQIGFYVFPNVSGNVSAVAYADSEPLFISAGETKDVTIHCNLADYGASTEIGARYFCSLYDYVSGGWFSVNPSQIVFTIGASGIEDITTDVEKSVSVTPNPAVDYATITAPEDITGIQLVSMAGATVTPSVDVNGAEATVEVASLPAGIYVARISTVNGIYTAKVVKK
ncbi:MAG: thiol protease/hemagglutinin PrtT [Duncaniella sp.]|nr:thiol protease/hemagglutinin PrtT [Duncaniella sp.]